LVETYKLPVLMVIPSLNLDEGQSNKYGYYSYQSSNGGSNETTK
jgi:hypothetical protein